MRSARARLRCCSTTIRMRTSTSSSCPGTRRAPRACTATTSTKACCASPRSTTTCCRSADRSTTPPWSTKRGAGTELYLSRSLRPDRFMVLDPDSGRYTDQSSARGLPRTVWPAARSRSPTSTATACPGPRVHTGLFGLRVFLQDEDGKFHDRTRETSGLAGFEPLVTALIAVDFDRDRRPDILIQSSAFGPTRLLVNTGPRSATGAALRFRDASDDAGLQRVPLASAAAAYLDAEDCDHAVDLLIASAIAQVDGRLHRFPDDSAGRTVMVPPGGGAAVASFAGACVQGSEAVDRLIGHRTHSVLRGGGGDDTLIARAGLTVLAGGPGRDRFEAAGFTIIHLPLEDIVAGETVDCSGADRVLIDSPLSFERLQAAGVVFEDCGAEAECSEELEPDGAGRRGSRIPLPRGPHPAQRRRPRTRRRSGGDGNRAGLRIHLRLRARFRHLRVQRRLLCDRARRVPDGNRGPADAWESGPMLSVGLRRRRGAGDRVVHGPVLGALPLRRAAAALRGRGPPPHRAGDLLVAALVGPAGQRQLLAPARRATDRGGMAPVDRRGAQRVHRHLQ